MFPGSRTAAFKIEAYVVLSVVQYKKRYNLFTVHYLRQQQRNIYVLGVHNILINMYWYCYFFIKIQTGTNIVSDALCQQSVGSLDAPA